MAWVWDSEVLNCPYVNQPINAEQSHITSALISLWRYEQDLGKLHRRPEARYTLSALSGDQREKDRRNKKRMKLETEKNTKC